MNRRTVILAGLAVAGLTGCSANWRVAYDDSVTRELARSWHVHLVQVNVSDTLTVSNANTFAPNADIVWHGEPHGDRRKQVAAILKEGVVRGVSDLDGPTGVRIAIDLGHFHAVTPAAVSRAPGAVHNIGYTIQVFDTETGEALTAPQAISADLDAYVGEAAVIAAIEGQTQRVRIVDHIARVTRSWAGTGPDMRGKFAGVGR
jgi:hypothetical protein